MDEIGAKKPRKKPSKSKVGNIIPLTCEPLGTSAGGSAPCNPTVAGILDARTVGVRVRNYQRTLVASEARLLVLLFPAIFPIPLFGVIPRDAKQDVLGDEPQYWA